MHGLKRINSAPTIAAGHAFVQNLRRGQYEITTDAATQDRVHLAFAELALTLRQQSLRGRRVRVLVDVQRNTAVRGPTLLRSDLSVEVGRQRETDRLEREVADLPPRGQWRPTADYGD